MLREVDRNTMAPCPFCGQQGDYYIELSKDIPMYVTMINETEVTWMPDYYQYQVECANCHATYFGNPANTAQEAYDLAILGWNRCES